MALYRVYDLPWSSEPDQNHTFRRILLICAGTLLFLGLVMPLLPVADRSVAEFQEVPERLARLVLDRQTPPPPPPVVQPEPEPAPIPEPEPVVEQRVVEPEPEPVPAPVPEPQPVPEPVVQPEPVPPPVDRTEQARERARGAGLMPFADELASLRSADTAQRLSDTGSSGPQDSALAAPERALITSRAGGASGGINTAEFSRDTAGGGLADRAVTQVESPVAGVAAAQAAVQGSGVQRSGESSRGSRSREEIEQVFDRNKSAIYALYNRALRQDPTLEGKVVLRLTIAPSGEVTDCEIVSSELGDPDLEQRLVQRVMMFQFEARDVEPITTTKPIDFFPA